MDNRTKFFKSIPFFSHLSEESLKYITDKVTQKSFQKGDRILKQGDSGDGMYLIIFGEVEIEINNKRVSCLKNNDFFGELALIFSEPRSATVIVVSDEVSTLYFSKEAFHKIKREIGENERDEIRRRIEQNFEFQRKYI